jgi:polysaccharide deacetylase family protein (PEP-CTERM system associated)
MGCLRQRRYPGQTAATIHFAMLNALTVDVEDYFQVTAFERQVQRHQWDQYPSRVVQNTHRLLRMFDQHEVRATFFVLGWVARRFPLLVRQIAQAGHELGCHSYWHRLIYHMRPDEFRADLRQAQSAIQGAAGVAVTAYRAPSFSIVRQTLWALEILREEGFESDSSIFPVHHDRYGIADACRVPHRLTTPGGELWEFPPSVLRLCGVNLPGSGGGYFRLFPAHWTAMCLARHNACGDPAMFYIHPWELDPDQPTLTGSWASRARHRVNLHTTEKKLDWLLTRFEFGRVKDILAKLEPDAVAGSTATLQSTSS